MRVKTLQLSNILSFKFEADIRNAFKVDFDNSLNIIIGGNGSGKSTALEAINFIFNRALFKHYQFNQSHFDDTRLQMQKSALAPNNESGRISPFRLQPNWQSETQDQVIRVTIALDSIDKNNIQTIVDNQASLKSIIDQYSNKTLPNFSPIAGTESIEITISFNGEDDTYAVAYSENALEHVVFYLEDYFLLNEAIFIHNASNERTIEALDKTFSMLSAFRNYTSFSLNTSLQSDPQEQFRNIRAQNSSRSNNQQGGEPSIFNAVKLHLGEEHQRRTIQNSINSTDAMKQVNELELVKNINKRLELINLSFSVECVSERNWSYEFKFYDTKHKRNLGDINSLSAGQKSIIHLIFEAYGQDDMRGGVVIIDEPEIHLHYQFQFEYLRILQEITASKKTQYIIVTHSEGFISSETAAYIKRFALDENRSSIVCAPALDTSQKKLIEILDNTRASSALFANKIVLVEGQDDEYFFRSVLKNYLPELSQDIAIYNAHSKNSIASWKEFFELYGLVVFTVRDLDATGMDFYGEQVTFKPGKPSSTTITDFKQRRTDLVQRIESDYEVRSFYLKAGAIEQYTQMQKGIEFVISFCEGMKTFLQTNSENSREIRAIMDRIAAE